MRRTKIHGDKGCHTALRTIKQGNQHSVPNRNPKSDQIETTIHNWFRHIYVLTKGCHTALRAIKQGNQHAVPNRNPKSDQIETTIHNWFRHVYVLTRITKIYLVSIYLIYKAQFCLSVYVCVCFNSFKTAKSTVIKLGTIDHHLVVSVVRGIRNVMMTS